jgi:hypothetical protein
VTELGEAVASATGGRFSTTTVPVMQAVVEPTEHETLSR